MTTALQGRVYQATFSQLATAKWSTSSGEERKQRCCQAIAANEIIAERLCGTAASVAARRRGRRCNKCPPGRPTEQTGDLRWERAHRSRRPPLRAPAPWSCRPPSASRLSSLGITLVGCVSGGFCLASAISVEVGAAAAGVRPHRPATSGGVLFRLSPVRLSSLNRLIHWRARGPRRDSRRPDSGLLEQAVDLEDAHVINRKRFDKVRWQRRFMAAVTLGTVLATVAFMVALATPNWAIIDFTNKEMEHVHVQLGVWGEWRTISNDSVKTVEWIPHFPEPPGEVLRLANWDLNHYYRAQAAFGVISLILMVANNCLAVWTFQHHRYMYKRLVACLFAFTAMCIVVTIEVLSSSVNEWNTAAVAATDFDYSAVRSFGYSTAIAWFVFSMLIAAAIVFAFSSNKQKGSNAATAEFEIEDRPIHIGR
uniref:Uncharacterized protein n=1 Tax=Plectus sambesii TaxID=2011161 RepID=A0A914WIR8_9BILA